MSTEEEEWTFPWIEGDSLAPPCQSDDHVVMQILSLLDLTSKDRIMDLGCGDGRICIQAAKRFGAQGCGIEIEPELVQRGQMLIQKEHLQDRVEIIQGDLLQHDLSNATAVVTYLLPEAMELLGPALIQALERGARVICNTT